MTNRHLSLFLSLLCYIGIHAQKLNVESFVAKTNDITARTQPRQDKNGNDCALVKVRLAARNASFSGNVFGDVAYDKSEYFVYMPHGSKRLTIKLEGYLPIDVTFQDYGITSLESKTVYLLTISGVFHNYQQIDANSEVLFDGLTVGDVYKMLSEYSQAGKDVSNLVEMCNNAANQGDMRAQNLVGLIHKNGWGAPVDYLEALKCFMKSANQGYKGAQLNLGLMYNQGLGVTKDYKEALKWYMKAAEQGDTEAQVQVGLMYSLGQGIAQDNKEALKWFRKSAEQNNAKAQYVMGMMYRQGMGVPQNDNEATRWYTKAAEQGFAEAQFNLGMMYWRAQDYNEALKWIMKSAEQAHVRAQFHLGLMYRQGLGVSQNDNEALKWYKKAAEQGNVAAQYNTISCLNNG